MSRVWQGVWVLEAEIRVVGGGRFVPAGHPSRFPRCHGDSNLNAIQRSLPTAASVPPILVRDPKNSRGLRPRLSHPSALRLYFFENNCLAVISLIRKCRDAGSNLGRALPPTARSSSNMSAAVLRRRFLCSGIRQWREIPCRLEEGIDRIGQMARMFQRSSSAGVGMTRFGRPLGFPTWRREGAAVGPPKALDRRLAAQCFINARALASRAFGPQNRLRMLEEQLPAGQASSGRVPTRAVEQKNAFKRIN